MKRKNGITISTLVLYIILLFAFVAIATSVSKKFELSAFEQKALAINMENYSRLTVSLNVSANKSDYVEISGQTITFSKGGIITDVYTFDDDKDSIYKNDSLVISDISEFNVNKDETTLNINLQLMKYSVMLQREIVIHV